MDDQSAPVPTGGLPDFPSSAEEVSGHGGKRRLRLFCELVVIRCVPPWDAEHPAKSAFILAGFLVRGVNGSTTGWELHKAEARAWELANGPELAEYASKWGTPYKVRLKQLMYKAVDTLEENLEAMDSKGFPKHSIRQQAAQTLLMSTAQLLRDRSIDLAANEPGVIGEDGSQGETPRLVELKAKQKRNAAQNVYQKRLKEASE